MSNHSRCQLITLPAALAVMLIAGASGCYRSSAQADPEGGSRLTLQVEVDPANPEGETSEALTEGVARGLRERLHSLGLFEPKVTIAGADRLVVELPGVASLDGAQAQSALTTALGDSASSLDLGENASSFPASGGIVRIDSEEVRYGWRDGSTLNDLGRGARHTKPAHHAPGAQVHLVSDDSILAALERKGDLTFMINATDSDFVDTGSSLVAEHQKLETWLAAHPGASTLAFNAVPASAGGPLPWIAWYIERAAPGAPTPELDRAVAVLRQGGLGRPEWVFTGESLATAYASEDQLGRPAISFKMKAPRMDDFAELTTAYQGRLLSITLDELVLSTATINGTLPGSGQIYGRFTPTYVRTLIAMLRAKPLPTRLRIIDNERLARSATGE